MREVIQTCERISGHTIATIEKPRRPGDPPRLVASAEKAGRELGWTVQFSKLEPVVASAWEWHRRHPRGYEG